MTEYIYDTSIEATFLHEQKREEIVRCRDCVNFANWDGFENFPWCVHHCIAVKPDGFCAWGERRERESAEVWNQWSADDVTCSEES